MHWQLHKVGSQGALCGDFLRTLPLRNPVTHTLRRRQNLSLQLMDCSPSLTERLRASTMVSSPAQTQSLSLWDGADEFTPHKDRIDAPPLPLPAIAEPVRVIIVRHGQSTWNAEGRIQGSTDLSVLTEKGVRQAEKTRDMLSSMRFSAVFQSPLARARQTADVVMQGQPWPAPAVTAGEKAQAAGAGSGSGADRLRVTLPSLREIDLYQFQGLLKHEGKALYGEQYKKWQKAPDAFELDGHAPVRELWYRASLAWQSFLQLQPATGETAVEGGDAATDPRVILVVAHNAINQALVATALGLPPSYFRRLPQNNAALSIFDLEPVCSASNNGSSDSGTGTGSGGRPLVTLSCLNQSPDNPFKNPDKVVANVVLITPPRGLQPPRGPTRMSSPSCPSLSTASSSSSGMRGAMEDASGVEELCSLASVLSKLQVAHVLAGPGVGKNTIEALLAGQQPLQPGAISPTASAEDQEWLPTENNGATAPATTAESATATATANITSSDMAAAAEVHCPGNATTGGSRGAIVEFLELTAPAVAVWERAVSLAAAEMAGGDSGQASYGNVLVVLDEEAHVGVVWAALGLAGSDVGAQLRVSPGGLSVIEFSADPRVTPATVRCINNTAHLSSLQGV
ncbi:hypothetical protein Vretifemale_160 [Volvox reticuliferus]|uniref:Phosphoglycerate mutase n=1 Tax=Volvox reticuliferus TaxID=1737510 RepID=A0A8J4BVX5_9CHLO|nr:hypothetical protein Vretifemale_160 [Volvox reticuliferus]